MVSRRKTLSSNCVIAVSQLDDILADFGRISLADLRSGEAVPVLTAAILKLEQFKVELVRLMA